MSLSEFPGLASSLRMTGIEICQVHLESHDADYVREVRSWIQDAGTRVVNVPIDVGNLSESDAARREDEIETILPWIDAAHALESPAVRVNTGVAHGTTEGEALAIVAEGYRRLAAYCADRDMTILLENHGGLSSRPEAIIELLRRVEAPNFRLCPDFGNFEPNVREDGLRAMLPHAAMVHAKVMDWSDDGGHPAFDLDRCLHLVEESGYSGPLSIEFEGKTDELQGVIRARDYLQSHVGKGLQMSAGER